VFDVPAHNEKRIDLLANYTEDLRNLANDNWKLIDKRFEAFTEEFLLQVQSWKDLRDYVKESNNINDQNADLFNDFKEDVLGLINKYNELGKIFNELVDQSEELFQQKGKEVKELQRDVSILFDLYNYMKAQNEQIN